ncbi:MAG: hypothetical protein JSU06_00300 [Actinobacteria bacterium]|nr:hypothetical protein [Actinomycetota bacterium]
MSPGRETRTLDGLSEGQLDFLREVVGHELVGRAVDLGRLRQLPDPRAPVREVQALGRLAYRLGLGAVEVPDREAREVVARIAEEFRQIDAGLFERHEDAMVRHRALGALLASLEEAGDDA